MPLPDFIRFFAVTDGSPIGLAALAYARELVRIAPVRVVSVGDGLDGPWDAMSELLLTPMQGNYVNCVCTHPSAWVQQLNVPMHKASLTEEADMKGIIAMAKGQADGPTVMQTAKPDGFASGSVELYKEGVRNVLFAFDGAPWAEEAHAAALKYESVIFHSRNAVESAPRYPSGTFLAMVPTPVAPDCRHYIRLAVLGELSAEQGVYR